MTLFRGTILLAGCFMTVHATRADQITFAYEGDILASDPSSGFEIFNACDQACSQSISSGFLTFAWQGPGVGDRLANFARWISPYPSDPPLNPFWIEWRFASNFPLGHTAFDSDGVIEIFSSPIGVVFNLYGDAIINQDASQYVLHLPLDEFRTFRFETLDGSNFCLWYDGRLFSCGQNGLGPGGTHLIKLLGEGGDNPNFSWPLINRWDYLRYGTMTTGEFVVSSDPPGGTVDIAQHPNFDRFTVTFDQSNYFHVDEVSVQVSAATAQSEPQAPARGLWNPMFTERVGNPSFASAGPSLALRVPITPTVIKTRRQDNGPPETVEIVLDQPMQLGVTYSFTFTTGGSPNTVTYTLVQGGACCHADGTCTDSTDADCASAQGAFTPGSECPAPSACCLGGGSCQNLAAVCCSNAGGTPNSSDVCEGDADHDSIDGKCGDECPADSLKTSPGTCGCGVLDVDSDGDGVSDCIDRCPGVDDGIDANNNGTPDCLGPPVIPTTNAWGLTILALSLLILAKVYRIARPAFRNRI